MAIEEVLLIGGAAGVGKSATGWEASVLLNQRGIAHWHLEGDVLDAAWPRPADDQHGERLTRRTLAAMAEVFSDEGYTRLVYVQTASVVEQHLVTAALGDVRMQGVLLRATEDTRAARLTDRERGLIWSGTSTAVSGWPRISRSTPRSRYAGCPPMRARSPRWPPTSSWGAAGKGLAVFATCALRR